MGPRLLKSESQSLPYSLKRQRICTVAVQLQELLQCLQQDLCISLTNSRHDWLNLRLIDQVAHQT